MMILKNPTFGGEKWITDKLASMEIFNELMLRPLKEDIFMVSKLNGHNSTARNRNFGIFLMETYPI